MAKKIRKLGELYPYVRTVPDGEEAAYEVTAMLAWHAYWSLVFWLIQTADDGRYFVVVQQRDPENPDEAIQEIELAQGLTDAAAADLRTEVIMFRGMLGLVERD